MPSSVLEWVRSFNAPDLVENNVLFDNTTPIYLINLLWKLGLDSALHYFSIFHGKWQKQLNEYLIFREFQGQ